MPGRKPLLGGGTAAGPSAAALGAALLLGACLGAGGPSDGGAGGTPDPGLPSCRLMVPADPAFGAGAVLSDPLRPSLLPSLAVHPNGLGLVAWHELVDGRTQIVFTLFRQGCVGPIVALPESLLDAKRPRVAATGSGFVIAYQARDGDTEVARTQWLDASGALRGDPETLSAPGATAMAVQVAAMGDDVAFAWTDGLAHHFARRGPVENLAAAPVGNTLLSTGALNFPRIAVGRFGELFLAYRDGGASPPDWDLLLQVRPAGGVFFPPANLSNSPGLASDDLALAVDPDGALDVVYVEPDPLAAGAFEVHWVQRATNGVVSLPVRYGTQGLWSWAPSVVPGLVTAWNEGPQGLGELFFSDGPVAQPAPIFPGARGGALSLGRGPSGAYYLAFHDDADPRRIRWGRRAAER